MARSGELAEGDIIMRVDDQSFETLTHSQAVAFLTALPEQATFHVERRVNRRQTLNPNMLRNEGRRHETMAAPAQVLERGTLPSTATSSGSVPSSSTPTAARSVKVLVSSLHTLDMDDRNENDEDNDGTGVDSVA